MTIPNLGSLEEVDLRQAWPHEAQSFTPWLAEHLDLLASVVGIPLELEGSEVAVDEFSADILARNPLNDSLVLIENQLMPSDHSHMGQIMTYLAGLEAHTVIWIASGFREAHLSAVRWLNDHTVDPFAFFAIKLKVVKISDSPLAPIFEVVVKPNSWERQLQAIAKDGQTLTDIGQFRRSFWNHYIDRYPDEERHGKPGAYSNRWRTVAECDLIISSYVSKQSVGLFIRGRRGADGRDVFDILEPHAEHLSNVTESTMNGPESDHHFSKWLQFDVLDESNWNAMSDWLYEKSSLYEKTLKELGQNNAT